VALTARSRRCYHRVMSGLERGGSLRFLTLTSSTYAPEDIQRSWRKIYMRMKRRGLITGYIKVPEHTEAGAMHLHVLFRGKYISQALLSSWWEEIHHSPVVDIRSFRPYGGKRRVASYMAKYMSKEGAHRYSWSWGWVWRGFCNDWRQLKSAFYKAYGGYAPHIVDNLVTHWRNWLRGVWQPDWELIEVLLPLQPERRR